MWPLRVTGDDATKAVKANKSLIRNQLVALFAQQTAETMSNVEAMKNCARKP